jgi:GTP-binding protein
MGIQFLRHIERTAVLLHILDISGEAAASGWENYETVNTELDQFNHSLLEKPQVVAVNKTDLTDVRERLKKEIDTFAAKGIKLHTFSAVTGEGLPAVLHAVAAKIEEYRKRTR